MADEQKPTTNAADRLLKIVQKAKGIQVPSVVQGFLKVFEILEDYAELYRRLSAASQEALFIGYLLRISENADMEGHYEHSRDRIVHFFCPRRFDTQWEVHKQIIKDEDIRMLGVCSTLIGRTTTEKIIEAGELSKILDDTKALREEVLKSDIKAELKAVILENLQRIDNAIHDYDVRGVQGLQEALILVGSNVRSLLVVSSDKDHPAWKYVQRLSWILSIVVALVTLQAHVPRLPDIPDLERMIQMAPAEPQPPAPDLPPEGLKSNDIQET
jgi:hypothetical protein